MKSTALRHSCPVGHAVGFISGRWRSSILCALLENPPQPIRFMDLQRLSSAKAGTPIARKVLSQELKGLERDGLVYRVPGPTPRTKAPLDIRYGITAWGSGLGTVTDALLQWVSGRPNEEKNIVNTRLKSDASGF